MRLQILFQLSWAPVIYGYHFLSSQNWWRKRDKVEVANELFVTLGKSAFANYVGVAELAKYGGVFEDLERVGVVSLTIRVAAQHIQILATVLI